MSEYIHEIVLQDYVREKIADMNFSVIYQSKARCTIVAARRNTEKTFWDLEGKLENDVWIPIEVEWISDNFKSHNHHRSKDFEKFCHLNGVLLTLRRSLEIEGVQQI